MDRRCPSWRVQQDPAVSRVTTASPDLLDLQGRWDPRDLKESWVYLDELAVQACWDQKEKRATLSASRVSLDLQDRQGAQGSTTVPKERSSPSLAGRTARGL